MKSEVFLMCKEDGVWFAPNELELGVINPPLTIEEFANLLEDPEIAATIGAKSWGWNEIEHNTPVEALRLAAVRGSQDKPEEFACCLAKLMATAFRGEGFDYYGNDYDKFPSSIVAAIHGKLINACYPSVTNPTFLKALEKSRASSGAENSPKH